MTTPDPKIAALELQLAKMAAQLNELNKRVVYLEKENRRRRTENNKG